MFVSPESISKWDKSEITIENCLNNFKRAYSEPPITGIVFGELAHRATVRMSRNGFTWYEKGLIILINPMYVVNNGFKPRALKQKSVDW